MTNSEQAKALECVTGCKHFYGGEIRHHKDCPFYPQSLSKMYDEADKISLSAPVKQIEAGEDVIKFLLGEGELDGRWYGDHDIRGRPKFWWRTYLREALRSGQVKPPETREQRMRSFTTASGTHGWCDPEIYDLVKFLNENGFDTIASCSGHGFQPPVISFRDGREIRIFTFEQSRKVDKLFPDINGVKPPMPSEVREAVEEIRGWFPALKNLTDINQSGFNIFAHDAIALETLLLAVERGYQG